MLTGQALVDYIGENLRVEYEVISNISSTCKSKITFINDGEKSVASEEWAVFMYHLRQIDSESLAFDTEHIVGGLFKVTPTENFGELKAGERIELPISSDNPTAARFSIFPNWYVAKPGCEPRLLKSTVDESLSFVKDFDTPKKWKRGKLDKWNPFTPEERFQKYNVDDLGKPGTPVLPTPLSCELDNDTMIDLSSGKWVIRNESDRFGNEAEMLSKSISLELCTDNTSRTGSSCIIIRDGKVENEHSSNEAYKVDINDKAPSVSLIADSSAGMFYAVQTIISLLEGPQSKNGEKCLPCGTIVDAPRFPYRGFHIDVSRNFIRADEIMKLIKVLASYKMNKLHFHLTDDEGWRLEIKDLPELTEVGGMRDHQLALKGLAVEPTLGSGPSNESQSPGFYTVEDYQNILRCAEAHHVEVIPEIDMPGHCYAAVVAMTARYKRLKEEGKIDDAVEYMLTEVDDESSYTSYQKYSHNTMNPCLNGCKNFVRKIISTLKTLHEPIQPLKIFHVGGDEVPLGAWDASESCQKCYKENGLDGTDPFFDPEEYDDEDEIESQKMTSAIQEYFMRFVEDVCLEENLQLAVWNDGVHDPTMKQTGDNPKLVHAWRISRNTERHNPNILANSGYRVVISSATHTYFDHPYEPDPEENGLRWCVRMMDTKTVFGMRPYDMYSCQDERFKQLEHEKLKNKSAIVGIQSQVWGELIRTEERLEYMLFPRMLAIAERAWHHASWEEEHGESFEEETKDWTRFANTLGYKELRRLEMFGIRYRIPPPGLLVEDGKLLVGSVYPNLKYKFRKPDSGMWEDLEVPQFVKNFQKGVKHEFATVSLDGTRLSRGITSKF